REPYKCPTNETQVSHKYPASALRNTEKAVFLHNSSHKKEKQNISPAKLNFPKKFSAVTLQPESEPKT
ncbi:hypothetical protein, partial [Bacteroides sp. CAG:633]|uniref:hypothetical protein n=1 Tax=Bacteroides sp. CAG:633 TaxID=1262744 RepID=UPI0025852C3D